MLRPLIPEIPERLPAALRQVMEDLSQYDNTRHVMWAPLYREHARELRSLMQVQQLWEHASPKMTQSPRSVRVLAWNIERGLSFEAILAALREDDALSRADILLLTEVDIGMARTENRNIPKELAAALGMHAYYANAYLCFSKGTRHELHIEGENAVGLHGNLILSRYPISERAAVPLSNCKDKFRGPEKRLGTQQALFARVQTPFGPLQVVCAHLDAHSSTGQRARQMKRILRTLRAKPWSIYEPSLIGGDWNTSSYDTRSGKKMAMSTAWSLLRGGPRRVLYDMPVHPHRHGERLFQLLRHSGFSIDDCNALGEATVLGSFDSDDDRAKMEEVMPGWLARRILQTAQRYVTRPQGKVDWFAARRVSIVPESARVLPIEFWNDVRLSDHLPIVVDLAPPASL